MSSPVTTKKRGGKRPGAGRKPKPRIIPHAIMRPPGGEPSPGEEARKFAASLRANGGIAIRALGPLLNPKSPARFDRIEFVTELGWKDGSVCFLEVRIRTTSPEPNVVGLQRGRKEKEYRHIFKGDLIWPLDPQTGEERTDRYAWCCTSSALMDAGLFIPSNSTAALSCLSRHDAEIAEYNGRLARWQASRANEPFPELPPPTIVFIWCEGEKSRLGIEAYLKEEDVVLFLEETSIEIATLGVLAGLPGAMKTNYVIRPSNPDFIVNGANDEALRLDLASHIYVRDNDGDGQREAEITCHYLVENGAFGDTVKIADPPPGVPPAWDDGDTLPLGISPLQRIKQILEEAKVATEQWIYSEDGNIDPEVLSNRRRAVKEAGYRFSFDLDTGDVIIRHDSRGIFKPSRTVWRKIAEDALGVMGAVQHEKSVKVPDWEPLCVEGAEANPEHSVRDAFMEMVSIGTERLTVKQASASRGEVVQFYRAEDLYPIAFGIPPTRYHQLCGFVLVRDHVARICRDDHAVPQSMPVLVGPEGKGKSEFGNVFAGGTPGRRCEQFTDEIDFPLFQEGNHGKKGLHDRTKGRTVVEIPDKALGANVSLRLNGILRGLVNLTEIHYQNFYDNTPYCVWRMFTIIMTLNREDFLNVLLGERRWLVINFHKYPIQLDHNDHNPGLNRLAEALPEIFADMYQRRAEWDACPLTIPPELRAMLGDEQKDLKYTPPEQVSFGYMLEARIHPEFPFPIEHRGIGIHAESLAKYFKDRGEKWTPEDYGNWFRSREVRDNCQWHKYSPWVKMYNDDTKLSQTKIWHFNIGEKDKPELFAVYYEKKIGIHGGYWMFEPSAKGRVRDYGGYLTDEAVKVLESWNKGLGSGEAEARRRERHLESELMGGDRYWKTSEEEEAAVKVFMAMCEARNDCTNA
jgi:hypothetical protein